MTTAISLHAACLGVALAAASAAAPAQQVRPSPVEPAIAAPPAKVPAMRLVSTPRGMMRVLDASPAAATPATAGKVAAIKAPAASPRVRSVVVNGASVHVLAPLPGQASAMAATPANSRAGMIEQAAPNGARTLVLPGMGAHAPPQTNVGLTVIDIDAAGHTARPSDALRKDVIFRRVAALPAH